MGAVAFGGLVLSTCLEEDFVSLSGLTVRPTKLSLSNFAAVETSLADTFLYLSMSVSIRPGFPAITLKWFNWSALPPNPPIFSSCLI